MGMDGGEQLGRRSSISHCGATEQGGEEEEEEEEEEEKKEEEEEEKEGVDVFHYSHLQHFNFSSEELLLCI